MSRRGLAAGLVLAAAAAVLAAALLWMARTTLKLEEARTEALRLATREEKVRLSLWRMDSALTALIGRENALPPEPFGQEAGNLAGSRFEVDLRSLGKAPGETQGVPVAQLAAALDGAPALPAPPRANEPAPMDQTARVERPAPTEKLPRPAEPESTKIAEIEPEGPKLTEPEQGPANPAQLPGALAAEQQNQMAMNSNEFYQRLEAAEQQNAFLNTAGPVTELIEDEQQQLQQQPEPPPVAAPPTSAPRPEARQSGTRRPTVLRPSLPPSRVETTFHPVWSGEDLYLVRRVLRGGEARLQGIRLDWPVLRASLLGDVRDLLPRADLLPIAGETADPGRRLALLPIRLVPGALSAPAEPVWTSARLTVAAASGAIALAATVVALLLLGSLQQGRRRADFVSAVTHELRTPLTTLRMYTEMLSGGMVAPAEQGQYLATLSDEANRLGHLVENVLAYSRLERRPLRAPPEAVRVEDLLTEMAGRLSTAAARGGFELVVHPAGAAAATRVLADRDAVERILLNWVDNACKYAAEATDRRLEIQPLAQPAAVVLRLRDHGPGIPREERRRIFRPFHKSAHRAAATAPGVGLGLTLSRRLARSLRGDLRLADPEGEGAAFDLHLRAVPPG